MKPCRECQHQISEQAFACPNCGAPFPGREALSSPRNARAFLALGVLSAAGAGYYTYVVLEAYRMMFPRADNLFSAMLQLVRFSPLLIALAPLVVLGVWRFWPKPLERGVAALVTGFALFLFLPTVASSVLSWAALR
jgi:hypothetical protein